MHIERADVKSLDAVLALLRPQFDEHGIAIPHGTLAAAVRTMLLEPARGAILLARDPHAIGLAVLAYSWTLEHGGLVAWLDELYVEPSRRGQGVGRNLLTRAIELATQDGCRAMELEVDAGHARAEQLYRREGFDPLLRRRWSKRLSLAVGRQKA